MPVTLDEKTAIRGGAVIGVLVLVGSIAFYMGKVDKGTQLDEQARADFGRELDRMEASFHSGIESVREEMRSSVDSLRIEMRTAIAPVMTREDARMFIESSQRQAALELQLPLLHRIGDLEGRVKSLEDNGHKRGGGD